MHLYTKMKNAKGYIERFLEETERCDNCIGKFKFCVFHIDEWNIKITGRHIIINEVKNDNKR